MNRKTNGGEIFSEVLNLIQNTNIVFIDLSDAFTELMKENESPLRVRRKFQSFVTYAQQLTGVMRTEFPLRTSGLKWEAEKFDGWDSVSQMFKMLRNDDQHDAPILIFVRKIYLYSTRKIFSDSTSDSFLALAEDNYTIDPFLDIIPEPKGIQAILADLNTGEPTGKIIKHDSVEYKFALLPRTDKTKELLDKVGNDNLFELSKHYFDTLKRYYNYYEQSVQKVNSEH